MFIYVMFIYVMFIYVMFIYVMFRKIYLVMDPLMTFIKFPWILYRKLQRV